jgi:hypothetical protein
MNSNESVQATCSLCGAFVEGTSEEFTQPIPCPVCRRVAEFRVAISDKEIVSKGASVVAEGAHLAGGFLKKAATFGLTRLRQHREHTKVEKAKQKAIADARKTLVENLRRHLHFETASQAKLQEFQRAANAIGFQLGDVALGFTPEVANFLKRELARVGSGVAFSEQDDLSIRQYLACLPVESNLANHVASRLDAMREIALIRSGRARPILVASGLVVRNSEIVWHQCSGSLVVRDRSDAKQLHPGTLYVTSMRLVFMSRTCPTEVDLSDINAVEVEGNCIFLTGRSQGKSAEFAVSAPDLTSEHIRQVVRVFHRQVDVGFENGSSRHIPQDVKTAVWQRDGGRCIQCGATDYLEFDHVIPVAKGGANTVQNVQLLCRRCNGQKSAKI